MDKFAQQLQQANEVLNNVGVRSAMIAAMKSPGEWGPSFRAAFVIAKSYFFLGDNLTMVQYVTNGVKVFVQDREDRLGAKMAFIDDRGLQGLFIVGGHGAIVIFNNGEIHLRGGYYHVPPDIADTISVILTKLITLGAPIVGLCETIDRNLDSSELEESLTKFGKLLVN